MKRYKRLHSRLSLMLVLTLLTAGMWLPAGAQERKAVVINFGRPNIWSLEQAHYLLARMRDQSLDLKTQMPDGEDLNPNASNGTRMRSLRTMFGAGVTYDQTAGLQNNLFQDQARFSSARRDSLLTTRDQLKSELRAAAERHSALVIERSLMNVTGASDAEKAHKTIEVGEADAVKRRLEADLGNVDSQLAAVNVPAGTLTTPTPPDAATSKLAEGVADKLLGTDGFKNELSNDVRLNASTVLDNHVQMQYEIIAKQLTLLRDEVGPGERLVFLELPQSIYTVPDKADRKLAQVWWRASGYYEKKYDQRRNYDDNKSDEVKRPKKTIDGIPCPQRPAEPSMASNPNAFKIRLECGSLSSDRPETQDEMFDKLQNPSSQSGMSEMLAKVDVTAPSDNRIRAVDLIPRQSSLNVNDIQDKVKNFNLSGALNFLFGFGARVDYQRQKRLYEQFVHQDIFASAFGKGTRDFGWTFGPIPGSERIAPGLHTTYAVLVVPEKAEAIELQAKGCFFKRTGYAPTGFDDTLDQSRLSAISNDINCSAPTKTFKLPIPGTSQNNFWVTGVEYKQVKPEERAVVIVHGDYFSPQIGVLVDGVPLRRAVGVAQVEVISSHRSDQYAPEPRGEMEFVNSRQLVLAFTMPKGYEGTPNIALVTPGRARVINDLRLVVNDSYKCSGKKPIPGSCRCITGTEQADGTCKLEKYKMFPESAELDEKHSMYVRLKNQPPMFVADRPAAGLSIGDLTPQFIGYNGTVLAHLSGTKFEGTEEVIVNGDVLGANPPGGGPAVGNKALITPKLYRLAFPSNNAEHWNFTVVQPVKDGDGNVIGHVNVSKTFDNPYRLKVTEEPKVLSFNSKGKTPSLTVKLVGSGFTSTLRASYPDGGKMVAAHVAYVSSRELVLTLNSPPETAVVTLTDTASGHSVATVVNRPPPPKTEPKPKFEVFEKRRNREDESESPR